jgi:hypothetical protein
MQVRFPPRLQKICYQFSISSTALKLIYLYHPLKFRSAIQKSAAFFLMLLFLISIAPKAYFHDLVADHKDFSDCHQIHHSNVLHQQAVSCHFDDVVVSAPFLLQKEQLILPGSFDFEIEQAVFYSSYISLFFQHKESRGPPSA